MMEILPKLAFLISLQCILTAARGRPRCVSGGKPFFKTLDGARLQFQGKCSYLLMGTSNKSPPEEVRRFQIFVHNAADEKSKETFIKKVHINTMYHRVSLMSDGHIEVDEIEQFKIEKVGGNVIVDEHVKVGKRRGMSYFQMDGMLRVVFGKRKRSPHSIVTIIPLSDAYRRHLEGICGNWNGKATDDLYPKGGKHPLTGTEVGNSWIIDPTECL